MTTSDTGASKTDASAGKRPADIAADVLLYAPLGLVAAARELLPTLAERGRAEMSSQVSLARVVGQLVLRQGQDELGRAVDGARQQAGSLVGQLLRMFVENESSPPPSPPARVATAPASAPAPAPAAPVPPASPVVVPTKRARATRAPAAGTPATGGTLAISDYDSLAASQVVSRLAGLTPDELEAVRRYETSTRGRRTVLGRIDQLQG